MPCTVLPQFGPGLSKFFFQYAVRAILIVLLVVVPSPKLQTKFQRLSVLCLPIEWHINSMSMFSHVLGIKTSIHDMFFLES